MSLEMRVEKLESEMLQVRKMLHHKKDENQHEVWNNMQEKIYRICIENSGRLDRLEADVSGLKTDVSTLKSDVSELKTDVSTLKSDVSGLKTDMSTLKSEMTEIKVMLQQLLSRE